MMVLAWLAALAVTWAATPVMGRLALRWKFVDYPGVRKVHQKPTPLLGGVAIYLGILLSSVVASGVAAQSAMAHVIAAATVLLLTGILDDRGLLHHQMKLFLAMPFAAALALWSGSRLGIAAPAVSENTAIVVDGVISLLWVVGITAAFSILDHMDGLCAGIGAIASGYFVISAISAGQSAEAALGAAVLGATTAFLWWNRHPAKIFMGDGGAMLLGFLIAVLALRVRPQGASPEVAAMASILILIVPIFDTALVIVSRSRRGLLPFASPGMDHTAHRLARFGAGPAGAVGALYAIAAAGGLLGVAIPFLDAAERWTAGCAVAAGALIAIYVLERAPSQPENRAGLVGP